MAASGRPGRHNALRPVYLLLLIPYLALLWPAWYATDEPRVLGIPFFYWYQFAWVIGSAILTWIVYATTRR